MRIHAHAFTQSYIYMVWRVCTQFAAKRDAQQRKLDKLEQEVCLFLSSITVDSVSRRCLNTASWDGVLRRCLQIESCDRVL